MPATKTIKISEEIKTKLDKIKIHPRETYDDVIRRLVNFYEKHKEKNTMLNSSEVSSTNTISRENTNAISKTISCVSDTHTNSVSREYTNTVSNSDEPKQRVFCKSKSEIRDINRYVKWLKENNKLIDWWDEETKYCFEVKE